MLISVQEVQQKLGKKACKEMLGDNVNFPYLLDKGQKVALLRRHVSGYSVVEDQIASFIVIPRDKAAGRALEYDFEVRYVLKDSNIRFNNQSEEPPSFVSLSSAGKSGLFFNQEDLKAFFKKYRETIEQQRAEQDLRLDAVDAQIGELSL
jgi:hypothetical protein